MEPEKTDTQTKEPKQSELTEDAFEKRKPVYDPTGKIEQINHDETRVADIRQHFFGLITIYIQTAVGLILSLGMIFFFLEGALDSLGLNSAGAQAIALLLGLISVILSVVFMILSARVYNSNQLIVTDVNITQVNQAGLFNRKVSELSMSNVEDVTSQQNGVFATLLNYGTLKIETAGEQNNFLFKYCPNPNAYAKAILDARSQYLHTHGGHHDNV